MGASATTPSTAQRRDHHATIHEFMCDIGLGGQLPLSGENAAACPSNRPEAIVSQFEGLAKAFRTCEAPFVVFELDCDPEDAACRAQNNPEVLFREQAQNIRAEKVLERRLAECGEQKYMTMPVGWQWWGVLASNPKDGGHLTVVVFDIEHRKQWFFNPGTEDTVWLPFRAWMADTPLVDGYECGVVAQILPVTLQRSYEHFDDRSVGCCTTMCALALAALWRCGPADPATVIAALTAWPDVRDDERAHRLHRRLWRWQLALTDAEVKGDREELLRLVGLRVNNRLAADGRVCGAFLADGVCANVTESGWCLCGPHLRALGLHGSSGCVIS